MIKGFSIIILLLLSMELLAQEVEYAKIELSFKNPPATAKPRTWYHVMSGNMSNAGVTKDLEAMADAGIGGIILFNVTAIIPKGKVLFNSPEHIDMIAHAATECERLGLSFGVHNCDGWTSSGGPWITPEHSMKKVVYNETIVEGGNVDIQLATPTARKGFYQDIAVLAYPSFDSEISDAAANPIITASNPEIDMAIARDGRQDVETNIMADADSNEWIQFDYGKPYTIRWVDMSFQKKVSSNGKMFLQTSNDGVNFAKVCDLKLRRVGKQEHIIEQRFDGLTARYFRVVFAIEVRLAELDLKSTYPYEGVQSRTSILKVSNNSLPDIGKPLNKMLIQKEDIINLSSSIDENGKLKTKLPKGKWTVMRFGYTVTGAVNGPASDEGKGLEVDKMSKESFKIFYEGYVRNVIDASKKVAPNALQYIEIDSYEVGGQNWTQGYETQFKEKFGYDIIEYLPLYAGRFINDAETTDDILWDVRNFNSDLITTNYFSYFSDLCHEDGLISYVEPYTINAAFNELDAAKNIDIPMGEFWMNPKFRVETAVSSAHIYGKKIVSAESFSALSDINWKTHPGFMKLTGDKAWTLGINEFMFHRFVHQANTKVKPGMTMATWGSHIDRTQTWWTNAGKTWFTYLARGQYMLRQGIPVADVLVFMGDGSPNNVAKRTDFNPEIPVQINYDCINPDALVNRIRAKNGKMVFPDGVTYRALVLYNSEELRLSTLKKLHELAVNGVIIIGEKPKEIGGFNISKNDRAEFDKLANEIWVRKTTYTHTNWDEIYEANNIPIDLSIGDRDDINYVHRKTEKEDIYFFYNPDENTQTLDCRFNVEGKIPELWNQMTGETTKLAQFTQKNGYTNVPITLPAEGSVFVVFRESSKGLDAITSVSASGKRLPNIRLNEKKSIEVNASEDGIYTLNFLSGKSEKIEVNTLPNPLLLQNPWTLKFDPFYSLDTTLTTNQLFDWKDNELEDIKYYSGTATYTTKFDISDEMLAEGLKLELDLGKVSIAARVFVNGRELGVLWKSPFVVDVTSAVKQGENDLVLEVTNNWTNRLIGDEQYPDETGYYKNLKTMPEWYTNNEEPNLGKRKAFCAYPFYKKGDPLISSGLLGPVKIVTTAIKEIK